MRLLCCTRCMMGKKKENNATGESCFLWLRFCRFNTFFCTSLRPNPLFPFLLLLTDSLRHKQKLGGQHLFFIFPTDSHIHFPPCPSPRRTTDQPLHLSLPPHHKTRYKNNGSRNNHNTQTTGNAHKTQKST